jgi:hypothetical protein
VTGSLIHTVITIMFLGLSLGIALAVTDLGVILALVGATARCSLSVPGFCHQPKTPSCCDRSIFGDHVINALLERSAFESDSHLPLG